MMLRSREQTDHTAANVRKRLATIRLMNLRIKDPSFSDKQLEIASNEWASPSI